VKRVLVTGATGFLASGLCPHLLQRNYLVRGAVRTSQNPIPEQCEDFVAIGDLTAKPRWGPALDGVDAVVHLAALVPPSEGNGSRALAIYRKVNADASEQLARSAAAHGVQRLVFLSSIKVNGEETTTKAFTSADRPAPADPYAVSKFEAEQALKRVAHETGLELVIVRPPLVYGPGVKGNLTKLLNLVSRGVPLPIAGIRNRRSMIGRANLCELLELCLEHPLASGQVLVAADDEALSTPELVRCLASALRRPARLLWVPEHLLTLVAGVSGRSAQAARLCRSLLIDVSATRALLGWSPSRSVESGLQEVANWYLTQQGKNGFD
jgi:UDP-glucose 4-epimerase